MSDLISRQAAIDAVKALENDSFDFNNGLIAAMNVIGELPSAQPEIKCIAKITLTDEQVKEAFEKAKIEILAAEPEWNNHTVACLLAELFGDSCACNCNGIDEWLPEKCELLDSCPNPVGVACWEQFLKHRAERRSRC